MSFCDHCEGQRFDRARVLRALRQVKQEVRRGDCRSAPEALDRALDAIRALEIPHLEWEDATDQVVH
jgi:hypothetical protein